MLFNVVPTLLEILLVCGILWRLFNWTFAAVTFTTILVYIGLAMFAALGLDPVIKWLGKHGVKRGWAIAIIFLTGIILAIGLLLLVVPTLAQNITSFVKDFPTTVANFEKTPFYKWLEGIFGTGLTDLINEVEKFFKDPKNVAAIGGGLLKVGGRHVVAERRCLQTFRDLAVADERPVPLLPARHRQRSPRARDAGLRRQGAPASRRARGRRPRQSSTP